MAHHVFSNAQRNFLCIVSPVFVALIARLICVLTGFSLMGVAHIANVLDKYPRTTFFPTFNIFSWEESYVYWGYVFILSVLVEMDLLRDQNHKPFGDGLTPFGISFFIILILSVLPSLYVAIYYCPPYLLSFFHDNKPPFDSDVLSNIFWGNFTPFGLVLGFLFGNREEGERLNRPLLIICSLLIIVPYLLAKFDVVSASFWFVLVDIMLCGISLTLAVFYK